MTIQRPPLLPLILGILGIIILCILGNWQLQRLVWKNDLQGQLDTVYAEDHDVQALAARDIQGKDFTFKRGVINGRYIPDTVLFIEQRTHDDQMGKHMYAAFRMNDGGVIFVNRGWVPQDFVFAKDDGQTAPYQTLLGLFKKPPRPNAFTPKNDPLNGQWYHPILPEMATFFELDTGIVITDYLFVLEDDQSDAPYPIQDATRIELRNQHLQYGVFWFMMAGILAVIFFLRFMRGK